MTKSLQEIQKENRKFILEAIYGCSYEEALQKELDFGCKILVEGAYRDYENGKHKWGRGLITIDSSVYIRDINLKEGIIYTAEFSNEKIIEVIGKPITLSRVLLALKDKLIGYYDDGLGYIVKRLFSNGWYDEVEYICDWNLTKETLEEQTEETQRKVNKLFNN